VVSPPEVAYTDFPIYREQLRTSLGFAEAELGANRAGLLGDRERRTQMRQLRFTAFVTMGFLVVGLFVSWTGLTLAFTAGIVLQSVLLLGATVFAVG
jgi:hypothetical protein